jgi:hypothetical protein
VVQCASYDGKIALIERQKPVLDVTVGRAGAQIENLEVAVPIHAHAVAIVHGEEKYVDWTGWVERPGVHALCVDSRLHNFEVVFA